MSRVRANPLTVQETAAALGIAPRTVRRLLQAGRLGGHKLGRHWVVWWPEQNTASLPARQAVGYAVSSVATRRSLRQVGEQLIAVGNQIAGAQPRRGQVFLTWRTPRSLQVTLAIGRARPTREWAPYALGVELPFWLKERLRWRRVLPVLRRYERLRMWCAPQLLRIPGVAGLVQTELAQVEGAVRALVKV